MLNMVWHTESIKEKTAATLPFLKLWMCCYCGQPGWHLHEHSPATTKGTQVHRVESYHETVIHILIRWSGGNENTNSIKSYYKAVEICIQEQGNWFSRITMNYIEPSYDFLGYYIQLETYCELWVQNETTNHFTYFEYLGLLNACDLLHNGFYKVLSSTK